MRKIVKRYRFSKFKRFMNGLLFAIISIISLILCITDLADQTATSMEIMLPFIIAILSLLLGFVTMFRQSGVPKQKKVTSCK